MTKTKTTTILMAALLLSAGACKKDKSAATDLAPAVDLAALSDLAVEDASMPLDALVALDASIVDGGDTDQSVVADLTATPDLVALPDLSPITCGAGVVDIATDPANCGACNHACGCGSTVCENGVCKPATLASGLSAPYALALDGATLYFGTDTDFTVWTVPAAGGAVASNRTGLSSVRGFAFTTTTLYATRFFGNQVSVGAKDGSGAITSFSGQVEQGASGIAIDANRLYWANFGNGSEQGAIRSGPLANGLLTSNVIAAPQNGAERLVLDADYVYWTSRIAGTVSRFPLVHDSGSVVTPLATTQAEPYDLAVDATHVYWSNRSDGTIRRRNKDGSGSIETIASGQTTPGFLVVDGTAVYFTDFAAGAIRSVPLAGGATPTNLATGLSNPLMLAQDASCLYATVAAGNVAAAGAVVKVGK